MNAVSGLVHITLRLTSLAIVAVGAYLFLQVQSMLILNGGWSAFSAGSSLARSQEMTVYLMLVFAALGGVSNDLIRTEAPRGVAKIAALLGVLQYAFWALMVVVGTFYVLLGTLALANGHSEWFWALIAAPLLVVLPGFLPRN